MPTFCVTARHSPLARRRLIVEASTDDLAVQAFLVANGRPATDRTPIVRRLGRAAAAPYCTTLDGLVTITVEPADPDCVADLPTPAGGVVPDNLLATPRRSARETQARTIPTIITT